MFTLSRYLGAVDSFSRQDLIAQITPENVQAIKNRLGGRFLQSVELQIGGTERCRRNVWCRLLSLGPVQQSCAHKSLSRSWVYKPGERSHRIIDPRFARQYQKRFRACQLE